MSLTINNPVGGAAFVSHYKHYNTTRHSIQLLPCLTTTKRRVIVVGATGKFESKNRRRISLTTTTQDKDNVDDEAAGVVTSGLVVEDINDDGYALPKLPGDKPDFWEGSKWDLLGFFVQYLWAFGILFALVACGIAVATYNEGATDFRETPAYKESIQSQDLLEGPEASDTDVFESNPTEEAPALE